MCEWNDTFENTYSLQRLLCLGFQWYNYMQGNSAGFFSSQDLLMQQQLIAKGNLNLKGLFMSWFTKALLGYLEISASIYI